MRSLQTLVLMGLMACASARRVAEPGAPQAPSIRHQARSVEASAEPVRPAPELYVRCAEEASCPSAVGMLVVDEGAAQEPERCTATLIASDRVLTASHCLVPSMRHPGAACPGTWLAFPRTPVAEAEWVACDEVEAASDVSEDALHQEHAILKLAHPVARVPLRVDPTPPAPGSIVTVASVTPHPIYGSPHLLTTRLCRAIDATPAQEALGEPAGNVGWLASCPIARGNSGSPVLDYDQRIRAIVHGGTSLTSAFGVTSTPPP